MIDTPSGTPPPVPWYLRPLWVVVLLFFVLGPLALPYLWKSPRFSHGIKVALTIAVIAYTGLLVQEMIALVHTMDLSHDPPDTPLPAAVASGAEPLLVVGAMAGG